MTEPQNFITRMLGVENLTDALEDEDADYLLQWGTAQLKESLGKIDDESAAGEFTNNLMAFMRKLNQISGDPEDTQPDDLAKLADYSQRVFGPGKDFSSDFLNNLADNIKRMTPRQAIEFLLQTFKK